MEKREFVESKLANLTDEFKNTKITGPDGKKYSFEKYVSDYLPTIMRDDFTFGDDDFIDNLDSLIMFQESTSGVKATAVIEMPRINRVNLEQDINSFIESNNYQSYLSSFVEYDGLIGTIEDMIKEFVIPCVDDFGQIIEAGERYSYQEFITKKIEELTNKHESDLRVRRTLKRESLLDLYTFELNYPVNNLNNEITTIKDFIDELVNKMNYDGVVEYQGESKTIDKILEDKKDEANRLYIKFDEKNSFVANTKLGISAFEDFLNIASLVSETTGRDNIIFTLLINLLNNINESLSEDERNNLIARIEKSRIKNIQLRVKTISILKGLDFADDLIEELDASDRIKIESLKQQLKTLMDFIDTTDEYTIETAYRVKSEFTAHVDELNLILNYTNNTDSEWAFLSRLENYKNNLTTRCTYEEEKESIISSYRKIKAELDSKTSNSTLDDFYFAFNSIRNRVEELKDLVGKRIKLSEKDQNNFDTICATVDKIKEAIASQDSTKQSLMSIL